MATKLKHQATENAASNNNVVAIGSGKCSCEGCNKKADHYNFCTEHYDWFKFGLITKEGKRPTDFDKKYQAFQAHRKHKAA